MTVLTGKTRLLGIIGDPISHSLSPVMQNAALQECGLDYVYVPFAVTPENLATAVSGLRTLGVCGFNVTIPHKTTIIPLLDRLDESAQSAGAVNTVMSNDGQLIGYNTDGDGLVASLKTDLDFSPHDGTILVIGAGGAARGAIAALCLHGASSIIICNRTVDHAESIKVDMNSKYPATKIEVVSFACGFTDSFKSAALLLNTTSLGMKGESIPFIDCELLPKYAKIYDMVYSKTVTPLLLQAAQHSLRGADGIGMLVAQGELAFEIWTGQRAPLGLMREVLSRRQ